MTATLSSVRVGRLTASALPALFGVSPYQNRKSLMREKVREIKGAEKEFTGNIATEYGHQHEDDGIAEYELTRGVIVDRTGQRQQTIVHPKYDYLAATPDGVMPDRTLDVKAPFRGLYTSIKERPDYEIQLRAQMECLQVRYADLAIWRENVPLVIDSIEYDPDWLPGHIEVIDEFMAEFRETVEDQVLYEPHLEPLKDQRTDQEWITKAHEWLELDFIVKQMTSARDSVADELKELAPKKSARGGGIDLLRFERKGSIQNKKIYADHGISAEEQEKYRGKPTPVTTIRRLGDK